MLPLLFVIILFSVTSVDSTRTVLVGVRVRSPQHAILLRELLMKGMPEIVHDTEVADTGVDTESASWEFHPVNPIKRGNLKRIAMMGARGFGRRR